MKRVLKRAQLRPRSGQVGVDITIKSAMGEAIHFAPTWPMVMGHKRGQISDSEYIAQYTAILNRVPDEAWRWLWEQAQAGEITVLCYCREDKFCHTHVLIEYMLACWPKRFEDGRVGGYKHDRFMNIGR